MEYTFVNRELSWLEFNRRVLSEALREDQPLLERLKFSCIFSSNLDEFFMVRVATVKRQIRQGNSGGCPSGLSPGEQLQKISHCVRDMIRDQYTCLHTELLPGLAQHGLLLLKPEEFDSEQEAAVRRRFFEELYPLLTPVRIEPGEKLTGMADINLYAAFQLSFEGGESLFAENAAGQGAGESAAAEAAAEAGTFFAMIPIPSGIDQLWRLPVKGGATAVVLLEDVVRWLGNSLFPGYKVEERIVFRVIRDADFGVDEERDEDFVQAMEQVLARRDRSRPVSLAVDSLESPLVAKLQNELGVDDEDIYLKPGPVDIGPLMDLVFLPEFDSLRSESPRPLENQIIAAYDSIWEAAAAQDILLQHPAESFEPVITMLEEAAADPNVLAIKMTLYRTSGDSPIVRALEAAAKAGKQVAVLVELKARFDEERNIAWAERLEKAGALVIYGIARLKVHAKALLIIRREQQGLRRYVHLGTGNYNDKTAKLYTDVGLISSRPEIAYEAGQFFNAITGYSAIPSLKRLIMAPVRMKDALLEMIRREAQKSSKHSPGRIVAKLNSLADEDIIKALYDASQQHVAIDLNIRGICMLVPGVKGQSESIRVVSVVDYWLEHTRAVFFQNGGSSEVYISSADWMPRNLERRVELLVPVEDMSLKNGLLKEMELYFADNTHAHEMQSDGSYRRIRPGKGEETVRAQQELYQLLKNQQQAKVQNQASFSVRKKPKK